MEEKKSPTLHFGLKWLEQDRARQSTTIHFNCVELPTARFTWLLTELIISKTAVITAIDFRVSTTWSELEKKITVLM